MARRANEHKVYAHTKLRRLRREHGMNQVDMARALGISASYANQIELGQRPLTASVLLQIAKVFGVDAEFFSDAAEDRLAADLRAALADEACGVAVPAVEEIAEAARDHPEVARALVALHLRYRETAEQAAALASPETGRTLLPPAEPHDEVRDFFYAHTTLRPLDTAAERTAQALASRPGRTADPSRPCSPSATASTSSRRRRAVPPTPAASTRTPDSSTSPLAQRRPVGIPARHPAGLPRATPLMDELADSATELTSPESSELARIGLANYFAGALLMPYAAFLAAAEAVRYDIELLSARFGVGFETVCHRLSTLQRTGHRGVPFSFLRVDRAGNISKRQSATDFHFSRLGAPVRSGRCTRRSPLRAAR